MRSSTLNDYKERIVRVLVHIQTHLDQPLGLDELAELACFSPYHFHRVFRGMVGESLMEHVRRLRLERAALQLKSGGRAVTSVAFDAGYETHEAFTRAFRARFGVSPSEFRETRRQVFAQGACSIHYSTDGRIRDFDRHLSGDENMQVNIETIQPFKVAFVRHTGPYAGCAAAWQRLCAWAGPKGLLGPQTVCLGICHDDPDVTPAEKIRYDACIVVDSSIQAEGEIGVQTVTGGDYVVTAHVGPHEKLNETYARLCGEWLPDSGREMRWAPSYEVYRNDPATTPPDQLVTDIHVPLA